MSMLKMMLISPDGSSREIDENDSEFDPETITEIKIRALSDRLAAAITDYLHDAYTEEGIGFTAVVALRPSKPCVDCKKPHVSFVHVVHGEPISEVPSPMRVDTDEKLLAFLAEVERRLMDKGIH